MEISRLFRAPSAYPCFSVPFFSPLFVPSFYSHTLSVTSAVANLLWCAEFRPIFPGFGVVRWLLLFLFSVSVFSLLILHAHSLGGTQNTTQLFDLFISITCLVLFSNPLNDLNRRATARAEKKCWVFLKSNFVLWVCERCTSNLEKSCVIYFRFFHWQGTWKEKWGKTKHICGYTSLFKRVTSYTVEMGSIPSASGVELRTVRQNHEPNRKNRWFWVFHTFH